MTELSHLMTAVEDGFTAGYVSALEAVRMEFTHASIKATRYGTVILLVDALIILDELAASPGGRRPHPAVHREELHSSSSASPAAAPPPAGEDSER